MSIFFKVDTKEGKPVAGLLDSDFIIYEKGINDDEPRLISVDEAERQISPKGQVFSYNTMLVLDLSGSVVNNNLPGLKEASKQFIDKVMPEQIDTSIKMGIWWFDGEDALHELNPLSSSRDELKAAIESINSQMSSDNSTDLYGAVLKSTEVAEAILIDNQNIISAVSVVIFTDGTDQAARYSKTDAFSAVEAADEKISFYTIGLGYEIDQSVLMTLGKNSSAFANNTNQLTEKFSEIAQSVFNQANSFYLFEYCSPKRNGSNELIIEVKKGSNFGTVSTSFSAVGFTGGCIL